MRRRRVAVLLAGLLAFATLPACDGAGTTVARQTSSPAPAELGDEVALTIYLRTGSSSDALLEPVTREVPIGDDLPHRAVELLLAGPVADEEGLESPWPEGTAVNHVKVRKGVATVDLDDAALPDPPAPDQPHLEALALASLANTLTEFPAVDEVELTVNGESPTGDSVASFWDGGWGIPEMLTRDVTLVVDESEGPSPELARFVPSAQEVGSQDSGGVVIRSVRVRDRITYLRLVVEIADPEDREASAAEFPPASARPGARETVLEVRDVVEVEDSAVPGDLDEQVEPLFVQADVGEGSTPGTFRIALEPAAGEPAAVYLHTSSSPSRIVMDVKK